MSSVSLRVPNRVCLAESIAKLEIPATTSSKIAVGHPQPGEMPLRVFPAQFGVRLPIDQPREFFPSVMVLQKYVQLGPLPPLPEWIDAHAERSGNSHMRAYSTRAMPRG